MAYTVPDGFVFDKAITVPTTGADTSPFEIPANETVLLVAKGTAILGTYQGIPRLLDAEYAQLTNFTWATSNGAGFNWGIRSATVTLDWGAFDGVDHEYGTTIVAESGARSVALKYADDNYGDNSGDLTVEIWRPVPAPQEPPPTCGCGSKGVGTTSPLGDTQFSTGAAASGSGGGITPSVGFQWNQAATDSDGLGGLASGGEFGDGWSRNDIAKLVMHGDDPANPDFVSVVFSGSNARVFRSSPDGSGGVTFVRANGLGPTDTLSFESGRYVFRSADATVLTFNGFGASVPSLARGALVTQSDASGNLIEFFFNPDGSINRLESFLAGQPAPVEIQQYVYLPAGDLNAGKVARIDIKRGDGTLVRTVDFSYSGSNQAAVGVTIDYATVGNPGNTGNASSSPAGMGAVADTFRMGTTEVTNAQYVAFLNAVDASGVNPRSVYDANMGSQANGGIVFNSGAIAGQKYSVKPGAPSGAPSGTWYGSMPVNYVTWFSAARFVNWLSNGQQASAASMETGTYTLSNAVSGSIIARNSNATVFLPSADEWHKAAFYDGSGYKTHATNSNTTPTATASNFSLTNAGNFSSVAGMPLNVGSYVNTVSAYGMYDMFGNVNEITDTADGSGQFRAMGGGYSATTTGWISTASGVFQASTFGSQSYGFRVASAAAVGVSINYATIGNPGNTGNASSSPADMGAVADTFRMGTTEVTNAQYVAFLNAVDASGVNPRTVYDSNMGSQANGGITFDSGAAAGQKYSVKTGAPSGAPSGTSYSSMPVNYVTWFSAARFVNWLSNGQQASAASMETGTYTLSNAVSGSIIARNSNATVFLPSADEWHKAAFFDGSGYKTHATNSNSTPTATVSDFSLTNAGNFSSVIGMPLNVGSYFNTVSPYGLYDMFGNVNEITDTADGSGQFRAMGGGYGGTTTGWTSTASGIFQASTFGSQSYGFRVAASALEGVSIGYATVGNPGNTGNASSSPTGMGAVADTFRMGTTEVSNAQYVAFLNAVDASGVNPRSVYDANMGSQANGGIVFNSGAIAGQKYSVKPGAPSGAPSGTWYGSMPVNYVTWFSAARFVNWLSNGQRASAASMETGTYTLSNAVSGSIIARNSDATVFLPSADEWHKAGFYDGSAYKTHATNSNTTPTATASNFSLTNAGNFSSVAGMPLNVGSYVNTVSAYGMYDMFGNVNEITDTADGSGQFRAMGGGYSATTTGWISTASGVFQASTFGSQSYGFRVASAAAVGDLVSVTVRDASSVPLDTSFYRYAEGPSGKRMLQYIFDNDAVRRATAANIDLTTDANNVVAPFATSYLEYDAQDRIVRHDLQGAGCSTCNGGIGSFEYAYAQNPATDLYRSAWHTKTTETRPDGTERITYANGRLQTMLEVIRTHDGSTTKQYGTYTRYDSRGNVIWRASPEAVLLPTDLTDLEQYPDLLNEEDGNFEFIDDTSGLIDVTSYFVGTTATATTAGSADRYVSSTAVQRGDTGTPILQSSFTYFVKSEGGSSDTRVATRTSYVTTDGTESNTTSYAYTYATGTTQIVSQTTTLPIVTTSQNGSNSADVTEQVFDSSGRTIWTKDADGFLQYTAYDEQTGSVIKTIVDVDTTLTTSFSDLPSGWTTPTGGGLHLVSTYEVDDLGRTTKSTDPNGSITYTVYDDVNHSVRTYGGWNSVSGRPTGPTQLSRRDLSGDYSESLTFSAAPDLDSSGRPTGTEAITNIETLSRSIMNSAGQVIASDRYVLIPTYSTATATLGTAGTNYLRTTYAYDDQGRVDRTQNPAGTITLYFYDGLGREVATYVGTDDSTTDTFKWTPGNASTSSNMTLVSTSEYDYGGVGNGNLTSSTQYPGGSADPRTTEYAFDWRNRLVLTKSGATDDPGTEDSSVNRSLTYIDYDNLSRAIAQSVYDGDGVSILDVNTDGVPDKPSAGLLRASQTSTFDSLGRVYQSEQLHVDQSSGAVGTASLTTDTFYDSRGNIAMVMAPNGPVSQYRYDGAGRTTLQLTLGNIPGATWANATSLTDSVVLTQVGFDYDPAGNTILTTVRERFHDASTSTTGLLGTPTTGIPARVSYVASYYDVGNRLTDSVNVGTNGGTAYTRPGTVPSRSDTVLVTSYDYDDAGRVQDVTDPMGIITRTTYDPLGRTVATILSYTGGSPGAQSDVTTTFQFDTAGRLASRTAVQPTGTPSQVTGYVYGVSSTTGSTITSNDFMVETRYPDRVTGLPSTTDRDLYTTNALGQRTSFTDRGGTTHGYLYDVIGRQTADVITTLGSGVDGSIRRIEMAYDTLGSMSLATTLDAATSGAVTSQVARAFNGFGQTVTEWQSHTGVVNTLTTPKVEYTYSEGTGGNHSRVTSTVYPDGYTVNAAYTGIDSAVSRPTSLTGQRADSSTVATLEAFKYLGLGTVIERDRPEVSKMFSLLGTPGDAGDQYAGLDRFGRVVAHNWFEGSSSTIADGYGYTYDRNSNRLMRTNALDAAFDETYTNDDLNQLEGYVRGDTGTPATTQDWEFDALGNWTTFSTDGVAEAREANAQNELTDVGSASLAYSATGNLTTDAQGNTLAYDAWNRLVAVYDASTDLIARYEYDGLNRRIVEQVGTLADPDATAAPVRDLFYSIQWQVLEERVRDSMGDIPAEADTRFIWSPVYVDAMVARDRNADANTGTGTGGLEERVNALQDANWNTTAIIAATGVSGASTGDVINRFVYTPYGVHEVLDASWDPLTSAPATPWSHLFQALKLTEITDLFYVRNRDYSASLGRFIERDPIGFDAGDNNWYRFVGNAPTNAIDPFGLDAVVSTVVTIVETKPTSVIAEWEMGDGRQMPTPLYPGGMPDNSIVINALKSLYLKLWGQLFPVGNGSRGLSVVLIGLNMGRRTQLMSVAIDTEIDVKVVKDVCTKDAAGKLRHTITAEAVQMKIRLGEVNTTTMDHPGKRTEPIMIGDSVGLRQVFELLNRRTTDFIEKKLDDEVLKRVQAAFPGATVTR